MYLVALPIMCILTISITYVSCYMLSVNVNFYMMGAVIPEVSSNTQARISNILYDTLRLVKKYYNT